MRVILVSASWPPAQVKSVGSRSAGCSLGSMGGVMEGGPAATSSMRPRGESDAASRGVLIFVPRPRARNLLVRQPQAAGAELRAMLRGEAQGMGERPDLIFGASLLLAGAA